MAANRPQTAHKAPTKTEPERVQSETEARPTPAELQRQILAFHTAALETAQQQLEAEQRKRPPDAKRLKRYQRSIAYHENLRAIAARDLARYAESEHVS